MNELLEIVVLSIFVSLSATLFATIIGVSFAVFMLQANKFLKTLFVRFFGGLMGVPPVFMGLIVYLLLSRKGLFGDFRLLFSPAAMIIAQTFLVVPIVTFLFYTYLEKEGQIIRKNCLALCANKAEIVKMQVRESAFYLSTVISAGFCRALSEVGAVMLVGGNIKGSTRTMTTFIAMETGKGNYNEALLLGFILVFISIFVNFIFHSFNANFQR